MTRSTRSTCSSGTRARGAACSRPLRRAQKSLPPGGGPAVCHSVRRIADGEARVRSAGVPGQRGRLCRAPAQGDRFASGPLALVPTAVLGLAIAVPAFIFIFSIFRIIPAGEVGVKVLFGQVETVPLREGLNVLWNPL